MAVSDPIQRLMTSCLFIDVFPLKCVGHSVVANSTH